MSVVFTEIQHPKSRLPDLLKHPESAIRIVSLNGQLEELIEGGLEPLASCHATGRW